MFLVVLVPKKGVPSAESSYTLWVLGNGISGQPSPCLFCKDTDSTLVILLPEARSFSGSCSNSVALFWHNHCNTPCMLQFLHHSELGHGSLWQHSSYGLFWYIGNCCLSQCCWPCMLILFRRNSLRTLWICLIKSYVVAWNMQEIISVYPSLSPPTLSQDQLNRACSALALLQVYSFLRDKETSVMALGEFEFEYPPIICSQVYHQGCSC
jgi:hypothetical protein